MGAVVVLVSSRIVTSEAQLCFCFPQSSFGHGREWGGDDGGETKENRTVVSEKNERKSLLPALLVGPTYSMPQG